MNRLPSYIILISIFIFSISCNQFSFQEAEEQEQIEAIQDPCSTTKKISTKRYKVLSDSVNAREKNVKINELYNKVFRKQKLNGCIYINQAGVDIYQNCFGDDCPNCNIKQKNSFETSFQLASLSKTFTAVSVLKLYEEKKLDIEDSIQKYYPNFPYKGITIKLLLSHRSGLPNYMYAFEKKSRKEPHPNTQQIMTWFEEEKPGIYYYPDRKFSYNNSNYIILSAIIEKVSGMSYAEYLTQTIFKPLDFKNTYISPNIPDTLGVTKGFEGNRLIKKDYFDEVTGDKGIYSSIDDLRKWYHALANHCIINEETTKLAFTPQSNEHRGNRNYGLGFRMVTEDETNEAKYIYHNGWWKGYNTVFWFSPTTETFVVILSNVKNKSIYRLKPIIKILENEFPEEDEEIEVDDLES
jgi:CubicO group peptidase (beta-lactamase class C family)